MTDSEYKEFVKRYEKFKGCNLPVPFRDEERQVKEYVYYDKNHYSNEVDESRNYIVSTDLCYALEGLSLASLYYSYDCGGYREVEEGKYEFFVGHTHAHSFEEVLRDLYDYPESFSIPEKDEEYYSKQELKYLKRIQDYLLSIGLKDKDEPQYDSNGEYIIPLDRYRNESR